MEYLNSRLMFGMVPGLDSTRKICEKLGNPEKKFKSIHVVGTNGKGSTSFYLSGILQACGLRAALYTSPHLVSLRERIRVNDNPISDNDLDRLLLQVKVAAEGVSAESVSAGGAPVEPTFFEVLTVVAFLYYAEQNVEVAVLEAGMGGRLDSTAVARGDIAVMTSIGLEHTEVLGATENAILKEKMGVLGLTPEVRSPVEKYFVVGGLSNELLADARELAAACGASVVVPDVREDVELPNLGRHYVENASLSLKTAEIFIKRMCADKQISGEKIAYDEPRILEMLKKRSWAGRMQQLCDENGVVRIILDGAHNSHAVARLSETLQKYYPGKKFHCLFGALKDKDVDEMLRLMAPHVSCWHITKTPYPRFRELSDLRSEMEKQGLFVGSEGELSQNYIESVLADAKKTGAEASPLLITGSLYMIGASVECLKNEYEGLSFFREMDSSTNEHR